MGFKLSNLLKKGDVLESKDVSSLNDGFTQSELPNSTIMLCEEIYHDVMLAKVSSYMIGTRIFPYDEASGIREGDDVFVSISSGVPLITGRVNYGYNIEKTIIMDLDADKPTDSIKRNDFSPEWDEEEDGEHVCQKPVIIKHKSGEKVISVDMAGLKIGLCTAYLFNGVDSYVSVKEEAVDIKSKNFNVLTRGTISESGGEDNKAFMHDSVFKIGEDGEIFEYFKEYKGDTREAMTNDGIQSFSGYGIEQYYNDAVYMMFIIGDGDIEAYALGSSSVKHSYKNRKLVVAGGSTGLLVNTMTSKRANIDEDSFEYKCIVLEDESSNKIPVVYVKIVTKTGEVFEYSAESTKSIKWDESNVVLNDETNIVFRDKYTFCQGNIEDGHYPIKTQTSKLFEFFGNSINSFKGDSIDTYYRKSYCTNINKVTEFEIDEDSGIDTMDLRRSPIVREEIQSHTVEMKDMGKDSKAEKIVTIKNEDGNSTYVYSTGNVCFSAKGKSGDKSSELVSGLDFSVIKSKSMVLIESETEIHKNSASMFEGAIYANEGLFVNGDLNISARNIVLEASNSIFIDAKNIYIQVEKSIYGSYGTNLYFLCTERQLDEDGKEMQAATFYMDKTSISAIAHVNTFYAKDSAMFAAGETLALGSKNTSISGI